MYTAKHAGRNNAQMYARSTDSALAQLSLTSGLHRALEREELDLHYQPIFDLVTGEVLSVEALIRWNHPERGLVFPDEFVSTAERNGLIAPISNWVAREACRQAATWKGQGFDLPVAFNLPPALWQPGLMRHLLATLEEFDLPADRVIVEITESALSDDLGRKEPLVDQLREAGLRLSIDDFGTGHSSLSRLAQLPVSTLKIDHSFIRDIPGDTIAATLVTSIIQLPGNRGTLLLRRVDGDRAEFETVLLFDSLDDIHAFAGDDIDVAVFFPEDDRYLVEREPTVRHFEVDANISR
jgi:EAL domain-containing protein (putative c-di-GMP-specific phosphodiesterase class I)